MSNKNLYEVFDEFRKVKTKQERIDVLRRNDSYALRKAAFGVFNPDVKFVLTEVPKFKREKIPEGFSYSHMTEALERVYLFIEGHPNVSPNLSIERKQQLLTQILESLEEKEANVFADMLMKKIKVPGLSSTLINEAYPGLLPV